MSELDAKLLEDRAVGFNISMPLSEFRKLKSAHESAHMTRSEWVRKAIKHYYKSLDNQS